MSDNLFGMASAYDHNIINTLWTEIMNVHWKFLDADESLEKLDLRKQLEELIFQYLCNMPHDRKFLLPSTVHVLKSSIIKLEDFSAYKASIGFEAISQYANNLFTKPWRKEYKTIKMYSGFYRHEIAANLINAERLFEEMGYRIMPNQTLILEGPICPDRVTNVSRDAITANVECQIMKEICRELTEMSLAVNWCDIYSFRECNTMDVLQSVQQMAALIKEKHLKNQQAHRKDTYGSLLAPTVNSCNSCSVYQFHPPVIQQQPILPPSLMVMHPQQQTTIPFCTQPLYNATTCSTHNQQPNFTYGFHHHHSSYPNYLPTSPTQSHVHPSQSSTMPPHPPPPLGAMPHSKSLDHYQEPSTGMYNLTACMQRHSIDQPPFDYAAISSASHYGGPMGMAPPAGSYDTVDSCNMIYNNHPYNVSGNRFPLPYNLSTNMNQCVNGKSGDSYYHQPSISNSFSKQMVPYYQHHRSSSNGQLCNQQVHSHRYMSDIYMNHNFDHNATETQNPSSILSKKKTSHDDYDVPSVFKGCSSEVKPNPSDLIYIDAKDKTKQDRKRSDRVIKANNELLVDYESDMLPEALVERNHQHLHQLHHQVSRNSRQSDFDSYEDEQLQAEAFQRENNVHRRISNKNQEGIGSYETWNYVFQNLEKQGYNKDLGERGNFLANAEEDEFPFATDGHISRGSTLKRYSNDKLKAMKPKSADKIDGIRTPTATVSRDSNALRHDRDNERNELVARTVPKSSIHKLSKSTCNNQTDNNHKANHINTNSCNQNGNTSANNNNAAPTSKRNSVARKLSTSTKELASTVNAAAASNGTSTSGGILLNHNSSLSHHRVSSVVGIPGKKKSATFDTSVDTIMSSLHDRDQSRNINNPSVSEWNCKFCTYLNPNTIRICEMCCKSQDFDVNSSGSTTAATSNGTATCV
ncbi:protein tamozhennic [Wyeomyia smithii]|uniref:protein tamozhennic n=1 Tax=Wyeomyia smithii TaxID=174621 RepID=UPI00246813B5|nr:protein tamozhennic [Wyeomyia smithii]XP_055529651.1 protein tamozhennic [Wyeomyia smithii]